ncbi:hypothetical protein CAUPRSCDRAFT_13045, partial [Caulochytrium protostelioides]
GGGQQAEQRDDETAHGRVLHVGDQHGKIDDGRVACGKQRFERVQQRRQQHAARERRIERHLRRHHVQQRLLDQDHAVAYRERAVHALLGERPRRVVPLARQRGDGDVEDTEQGRLEFGAGQQPARDLEARVQAECHQLFVNRGVHPGGGPPRAVIIHVHGGLALRMRGGRRGGVHQRHPARDEGEHVAREQLQTAVKDGQAHVEHAVAVHVIDKRPHGQLQKDVVHDPGQ